MITQSTSMMFCHCIPIYLIATYLFQARKTFRLQKEESKRHQHKQTKIGKEGSKVP